MQNTPLPFPQRNNRGYIKFKPTVMHKLIRENSTINHSKRCHSIKRHNHGLLGLMQTRLAYVIRKVRRVFVLSMIPVEAEAIEGHLAFEQWEEASA